MQEAKAANELVRAAETKVSSMTGLKTSERLNAQLHGRHGIVLMSALRAASAAVTAETVRSAMALAWVVAAAFPILYSVSAEQEEVDAAALDLLGDLTGLTMLSTALTKRELVCVLAARTH